MENNISNLVDEKYNELSIEERQELYSFFKNKETAKNLKENIEKIIFRIKPPTPEEFLDPENEWISKHIAESIFPEVRKTFINILKGDMDGNSYDRVVLYGSTRQGKSLMSLLLIVYVIIFFHCLREPTLYWGLSPLSHLCIFLISFNYDKIEEVYLSPLYTFLSNSKRFIRVMKSEQVVRTQQKIGLEKIVWSSSATSGEITLESNLELQLGNDDTIAYLGSNILFSVVSEIAFFCEKPGVSEERVYKLYTQVYSRIKNTVKNGFLGCLILDSSARYADSIIESHIIKELQNRKGTYFSWKARWEVVPGMYPIWEKTGQTFKVITGNGDISARIVENENELKYIPKDLVIDVPIDALQIFKDNLITEIRDSAGRPTSNENKFINDGQHIINLFNNNELDNIEGLLICDAKNFPKNLLWDKLKDKFFTKNASGKYMFKRAPDEYRYYGWDIAYSLRGDLMGFSCIHKEWDEINNKIIFVTDFSFVIGGGDIGINLSCVPTLLLDIKENCNVNIYGLYTDTFQSQPLIQELERYQIQCVKQSVDETLTPYVTYLTHLTNESIKCGKNIFLKNNLSCLIRTKRKGKEVIDHPKGTTINQYDGNWNTSKCGINAKDCSDSHCQAFFGAYSHQYQPTAIYQLEQKKFSTNSQDVLDLAKDAYKKLHKIY